MNTCISSIPKPTLGPRLKFISQIYECLMYKANHIPRTNHLQYVHPPKDVCAQAGKQTYV